MPLMLNSLFGQMGISPKDVRLLRHQDHRSDRGRSPYELWRDNRPAFELYQSAHSFQHRSILRPATYWASFVVTPAQDTLLAGLYRASYRGLLEQDRPWPHTSGIDLAGSVDAYELVVDDLASDLEGRLVIEWGAGTRSRIQRADLQNKVVLEIAKVLKDPDFPGFARFVEPLSRIEVLPKSWIDALRSSRGVYLLTCPTERQQYVGSATGEQGFWGRWTEYARTGHGGNHGLRMRDPADYDVSILEVAGSLASSDQILDMEAAWKKKLKSREMGLNRN